MQHTLSQASFPSDPKPTLRSREHQFLQKYGHRHHTYDSKKAPYPLSYDKELLEMCVHPYGFCERITHAFLAQQENRSTTPLRAICEALRPLPALRHLLPESWTLDAG